MAKNKKDNIDSFSGMFKGIEPQIEGQEKKLEDGEYMPQAEEPKIATTENEKEKIKMKDEKPVEEVKKKRGRKPLLEGAKKERYSFTIKPNIYNKALDKAGQEGRTLSELISEFLSNYIK